MTGRIRIATMVVGLAAGMYGVWLLLALGWSNTFATLEWLVGGVVLHDGVFAGITMAVALVAARLVRPERLAPWVVALVILVPVTLVGIPELGRFGARAGAPTLLDRHYWVGWLALVALVVVAVVVGTALRERRRARPAEEGDVDGTRAGR